MQLRVIWNLVLQPDSEGPTLISHAAWRSRTLLKSSFHNFAETPAGQFAVEFVEHEIRKQG
jgi:hypothetical protein